MIFNKWSAYCHLARFDKPVGIWLLWFPCAWALWGANQGKPTLNLSVLFFLGTLFMRSAGCVMNDIADRHIDKHVARTRLRPLTRGIVSLIEALTVLLVLLFASLIILLQLPNACFYLAIPALVIALTYPFCKRFLDAPQIILGLAFSMGIPMVYVASQVAMDSTMVVLLIINFLWIIAYDTMYAMTDREDDLKIGVKSTAIYFANYDTSIIGLLQFLMHSLWLYWGVVTEVSWGFYYFWFVASSVLFYQQRLINKREPQQCFKAFKVSVYYGALMWIALIVGYGSI